MNRTKKKATALGVIAAVLIAAVAWAGQQPRPVEDKGKAGAVFVTGGSLLLTDAMATSKFQPESDYPASGVWLTLIPSAGTVFETVIFDSTGATEITSGDFKEGASLTAGSKYEWKFGVDSTFQYDWRPATSGTLYFVLQESEGAPR
jgi:hypothetical protein